MSVYTVHEPPRPVAGPAGTDKFVFVRDGFYGWAFLLTPLWLLARRLWLVLLLYCLLMAGLEIGLAALGVSTAVKVIAGLLVSFLAGMEAASLRRWTLQRRGWRTVGLVVGEDIEVAERRFFDSWTARTAQPLSVGRSDYPPPANPPSGIIGLFPEPGVPR